MYYQSSPWTSTSWHMAANQKWRKLNRIQNETDSFSVRWHRDGVFGKLFADIICPHKTVRIHLNLTAKSTKCWRNKFLSHSPEQKARFLHRNLYRRIWKTRIRRQWWAVNRLRKCGNFLRHPAAHDISWPHQINVSLFRIKIEVKLLF